MVIVGLGIVGASVASVVGSPVDGAVIDVVDSLVLLDQQHSVNLVPLIA